ncbi:MAG: DegV family protein [Oscillospiraceae bacterium]|jgi:DegV family protein with EDD domain|nr:DegV family protein [Oscillospiraceae bacterium]
MEARYAIIGDVTCDLSLELRERFGIDGYTTGHITIPGGKEIDSKLEWDFTNPKDFYSSLKSKGDVYKTSSASMEEIAAYWETYLAEGKDVLALSISGKLSVTYNLMINAQKMLQDKYPARKIVVVDSRRYSVALGILTIKACQLRGQGLSIEENADKLNKMKNEIHQMGTMDDLFFVASKGRISHPKAFLGTLVGIKPMGDFDSEGMVTVLAKVKGYEKAHKAIIGYIEKTITDASEQIIIVAHTMRADQAGALVGKIKESIRPKEVILSDVYPASGINIGPGLLAAYYFGSEITDLAKETEIMEALLKVES